MFCTSCGKELNDNEKFCRFCGTQRIIPDASAGWVGGNFDPEVNSPKPAFEKVEFVSKNTFAGSGSEKAGFVEDGSPKTEPVNGVRRPMPNYTSNISSEIGVGIEEAKPKKKHTALIAIISVLSVLLLLVIGTLIYMYVNVLVFDFDKLCRFEHPFSIYGEDEEDDAEAGEDSGEGEDVDNPEPAEDDADISVLDGEESNDGSSGKVDSTDEQSAEESVAAEEPAQEEPAQEEPVWEGETGSFYACSGDIIPAGVDNVIWGLNMEELKLYTGIQFKSEESYPNYSAASIYRFPAMDTDITGVSIDSDSYVIVDEEGKVCGMHMEYLYSEKDIENAQLISEKLLYAASNECDVEDEYLYYDDYPFISYSVCAGDDYKVNVIDNVYTFCSNTMLDNDDVNGFGYAFNDMIQDNVSEISTLKSKDDIKPLGIDINTECAKITKEKNSVVSSMNSLNFYSNDNGLVSWYLKKDTPVYVQCNVGYHEIDYERTYYGNGIVLATVKNENGYYDYYFNKNILIRVVDSRGNIHDYGSMQWSRYTEIGQTLIDERNHLSETIHYYHQVYGK